MKNLIVITFLSFTLFLLSSCGFKDIDGEVLIPVQGVWSGTDSLNRHVTFLFNKDSSVCVEIKQYATATTFLNRYFGTYKVETFVSGLAGQRNHHSITGTIKVNRQNKSFSFVTYAVYAKDMLNANVNFADMTGYYNTTNRIPVTLKNIYPYYYKN